MPEPQIRQLNVEVTHGVKEKLKQLEADLADERASQPEIVAVLVQTASARKFSTQALKRYRREVRAARQADRKAAGPVVVGDPGRSRRVTNR